MYGCDLSHYQLQKYLRFLVARGFLELDKPDKPRKIYKPTAEGDQLLTHIDRLRELLELRDRDAAPSSDFEPVSPDKRRSPALTA